jgi:hypothetical protein
MRKICLIAALAVLGVMIQACQLIIVPESQQQQNTSPENENQKPENQEPTEDPILKVRTFGAYGIDGEDYVYQRGSWQISRKYTSDNRTVTFNMADPVNRVVYSVSGLKPSISSAGQNIYVTFTAKTPDKELKSFSSSAKVLKVSGDTLWLKTSGENSYYVVKK